MVIMIVEKRRKKLSADHQEDYTDEFTLARSSISS
jgi:hypothetical protein